MLVFLLARMASHGDDQGELASCIGSVRGLSKQSRAEQRAVRFEGLASHRTHITVSISSTTCTSTSSLSSLPYDVPG